MTAINDAGTLRTACDAAIAYARRGWHVFPCWWLTLDGSCACRRSDCNRPGKHPIPQHGLKDATTDEAQILAWWARHPDAQVAVNCGAAGIAVIDLDMDGARGKDGEAEFRAFLGPNPESCALIARTPRGGRHLVYADPDHRFGSAQNVGSSKAIDVRAVGGYIILPSPASPGRAWIVGDPLDGDEPSPPPDHLLPLLPPASKERSRESGSMSAAGTAADERLAEVKSALWCIPPSERRDVWLQVIWAVHAALDADERGAELVELWSSTTDVAGQHKPGEAWRIYSTAVLPWKAKGNRKLVDAETLFFLARKHKPDWKWLRADEAQAVIDAASHRPLPPPSEPAEDRFPSDLLDGDDLLIRVALEIIEKAIIPQPALALCAVIPTFGAILGRRVKGPLGMRTNIYTLGIGPTGCGKDFPFSYCGKLLNKMAPDLNGPRSFMSESGVYAALLDHPSQVALIDEFGIYLQSVLSEDGNPYVRAINRALLSLFSNSDSTVQPSGYANRQLNKPIPIIEPCLSIGGMTTPERLFEGLSCMNVDDGLLGRIFAFEVDEVPEKPLGLYAKSARRDLDPSPAVIEQASALIDALKPAGNLAEVTCGQSSLQPTCREFLLEDDGVFLETVVRDEERRHTGNLAPLWKRLEQRVIKLALIRAAAANPAGDTIPHEFVEWAFRLTCWCTRRMERGFAQHAANSSVERDLRKVAQIIDRAGLAGITASALTRKTQWLRRTDRKDMLASLVEGGEVVTDSEQGGGNKTIVKYWSARFRGGAEEGGES